MLRVRLPRLSAHVALLAMLALSMLPTLGRLASPASADPGDARTAQVATAFGAMCGVGGLRFDAAIAASERLALDLDFETSPPGPAPHDTPDCDYCALVATPSLPATIAIGHLAPDIARFAPFRSIARHSRHHPSGLGSRGPPA